MLAIDMPNAGFFTRYVLENPYPLTVVLIVAALGLAWMGLREGRRAHLHVAIGCGAAGAIVLAVGLLVTTPAEHGERVTRSFVEHVVAGDTGSALNLVSPNAVLSVGSPRNPGMSLDFLRDRMAMLHQRYTINNNRITTLRGYTDDADTAIVRLACSTQVDGFAPTPSQWVLRIQRNESGEWLITQITAISIAHRTPSERLW